MTDLSYRFLSPESDRWAFTRGDPVTATLVATAATAAITAGGAIMQGQQQASAYNAQKTADLYNAQTAQQAGTNAVEVSAANEAQQRRKGMAIEGAQYAALSETNPNSPTSEAVARQQAINDQLDALNIRYQGQMANYGYQSQAQSNRYQADIERWNAQNASTGGWLTAGMTLAKAGASAYGASSGGGMFGLGSSGSGSSAGGFTGITSLGRQNWLIPGGGGYGY